MRKIRKAFIEEVNPDLLKFKVGVLKNANIFHLFDFVKRVSSKYGDYNRTFIDREYGKEYDFLHISDNPFIIMATHPRTDEMEFAIQLFQELEGKCSTLADINLKEIIQKNCAYSIRMIDKGRIQLTHINDRICKPCNTLKRSKTNTTHCHICGSELIPLIVRDSAIRSNDENGK